MPQSVGGVACTFVKGNTNELGDGVFTWRSVGQDGIGAQKTGRNKGEFSFRAILYGNSATMETFIAAIRALRATVVSIEDDWGITHTNLLITETSMANRTPDAINGGRVEIQVSGLPSGLA